MEHISNFDLVFFVLFTEDDSDAADESDDDDPEWVEGDRPAPVVDFTGNPGLRAQLPDSPSVLDFFFLFVSVDVILMIVDETNRYARQYLETAVLRPTSRMRKWVEVTLAEMKVFLALNLAMGLVTQKDVAEYWTSDPVTSTPFFPSTMSRDRFFNISTFLHMSDNTLYIRRGQPGYNPLQKLGAVFTNVITKFRTVIQPSQQLSLDEGMIPWRGNLHFRVYNPDKPNKYGIKAYMVCDSSNGYCFKFELYTGKTHPYNTSGNGVTYDLVMHMMRDLFGQGYQLYVDNYYSSPTLFSDLRVLGVTATGTLRTNRKGVPQELKDKKLQNKGDKFVMNDGSLMAMKWYDRKPVVVLSSIHTSEPVATGKTDPRTHQPIIKPHCIAEYNKYMGGVDRSDQMVSYTTNQHRTTKWWKRVFFHVLSLATLNGYLVYKMVNPGSPMLQRHFRRSLVAALVASAGDYRRTAPVGRPRKAQEAARLVGAHFLEKIPRADGQRTARPSLACKVCNQAERELSAGSPKKRRPGRESCYRCKLCQVALCVVPCMELYHTKSDPVQAYKRWKQADAAEQ